MSLEHNHDLKNHENETSAKAGPRDERYWLSLEQWGQDPEFQKMAEAEFQSSPLREGNEKEEGWARREFLKLMGASLAMSAAGCIRRPVQNIVPYNKAPEEVTFGVDNRYTSVFTDGAESLGVLVKTREGRPLMVEGNPHFPTGMGSSSRGHAHLLSLYDPERSRTPLKNIQRTDSKDVSRNRTNHDTITVKWEDADQEIVKGLSDGGVAVLVPSLNSPSTKAVVADFAAAFGAKTYTFDDLPLASLREGQQISYGTTAIPSLRVDQAKLIVSVDGDFLGTLHSPTAAQFDFANARREIKTMNRLVAFESHYSLTGANADIRVRIKPSEQLAVVLGLAHDIIIKKKATGYASNGDVAKTLTSYAGVAAKLGVEQALWDRLVDDLIKNAGESLVVAGGLPTETKDAVALQIAVNFLNSALGNDGKTVDHAHAFGSTATGHDLADLIADLEKGQIKALIIHGQCNPVYASPLADKFVAGLKKAKLVVSTADRNDETAVFADYVLPDSHVMEGWNDAEPVRGLLVLQQPTIRPMYDTRSFQSSLMTWAYLAKKGPKRLTDNETFYDYLRAFWKSDIHPKLGGGKAFDAFWDEALQTGFVGAYKRDGGTAGRSFKVAALGQVPAFKAQEGLELALYATTMFKGGTLTNVSWLHELPDPITKIVWDNYLNVSLKTAATEKLKEGDLVELTVGEKKVTLPVHIQPGLHDQVVTLAVGYGRTRTGKVGNGVGIDATPLMAVKGTSVVASGQVVSFKKTGKNSPLANVQGHHTMEGRKIVVEATLNEYLKDQSANNHNHHVWSMWGGHEYNGHKWAMVVDLNTCTGCSSCMVACQSENNVPVVGKRYVLEGREMHWMRIDRYYVGTPENAEVVFQPVMCQQCDNAPCETVCPVLATAHSSEGLNDMSYNRCVGTRYCANNCPYKVRRFNWFAFTKNIEKPLHMALNPDVTVRMRGVMEKCTFCVHRIKAARQQAKIEKRDLKDGDIKTACETSCAAGSIIFGDINDPKSRVSKMYHTQRGYALLEEFGAAPSVRYLSKIRNNSQDKRFQDSGHGGESKSQGSHS